MWDSEQTPKYGPNIVAKCFGNGEELFFHEESGGAGIVEDVAEFTGREADV